MKEILKIFLLAFTVSANVFGQVPDWGLGWAWAKSSGGTLDDMGQSIAIDSADNIYVAGYFKSATIVFGNTTLTNYGGNDIFIVKYNTNGDVIWAKSAGSVSNDYLKCIKTDYMGNLLITGSFSGSSISFDSITLTNNGGEDIFLTKFDSTGNVVWAKSAGGSGNERGNSIASDVSGNVYVTGYIGSTSVTFDTINLNTIGTSDFFIVKYDANGAVNWAKSAGGTTTNLVLVLQQI